MGACGCRVDAFSMPEEQRKRITALTEYWFTDSMDRGAQCKIANNRAYVWFSATPEIDKRIKERFEPDMEKYAMGDYASWHNDRDGRLAVILLLSKFSRNFYRNDGAMIYSWDKTAISLTLKTLTNTKVYDEYHTFEKVLLLMPLL